MYTRYKAYVRISDEEIINIIIIIIIVIVRQLL